MSSSLESDPTIDNPKPLNPNQESTDTTPTIENQEDEEEGECGFCLFMKGGVCKQVFINWEKCIEEGEENKENIVDKCFEATSALKKCMEANPDYYGPIEKAAEQEAIKQLDKEKEVAENSDSREEPQKQVSS